MIFCPDHSARSIRPAGQTLDHLIQLIERLVLDAERPALSLGADADAKAETAGHVLLQRQRIRVLGGACRRRGTRSSATAHRRGGCGSGSRFVARVALSLAG